jgi:ATP-binding cassette subfamily F protein 3
MLKEALQEYDGTLIIVSHDRGFLQGLTNRLFEFTPSGVKEHLGDINEFLRVKRAESFRDIEMAKSSHATTAAPKETKADQPGLNYQERKQLEKDLRKLKNKVSNSEKKISSLESEISSIEQKLQDPEFFQSVANDNTFFMKYDALKQELTEEMEAWERFCEQLESLENQS